MATKSSKARTKKSNQKSNQKKNEFANHTSGPGPDEIKATQEVISVNATERLSIVGFYGAVFIGIVYSLGDLGPVCEETEKSLSVSVIRTQMGFFLVFLGILVYQILRKYNFLIKLRSRVLKKEAGWILLNEKNQTYDGALFSITNLLPVIMIFMISVSTYIMVLGLFHLLTSSYFQCPMQGHLYLLVPILVAGLLFLLLLFLIRYDKSKMRILE